MCLLLEHRIVRKKQKRSLQPLAKKTKLDKFTMSLKGPSSAGNDLIIEVRMAEDESKTSKISNPRHRRGPFVLFTCLSRSN